MAKSKEKKEKKYNFKQVIICEECKFPAEIPGPCVECGKMIFTIQLIPQEI